LTVISSRNTIDEVSGAIMKFRRAQISVKLPIDLVDSARIISAHRKVAMIDLFDEILRPALFELEREELTKHKTKSREIDQD